jgi:hypothetical protein
VPTLDGILSGIRGAHATGAIPFTERLLNSALNDIKSSRIQEIDIRIGENNRLQTGVRVSIGPFSKWFRPELSVDKQALWSNSPGLLLTMPGAHYGIVMRIVEAFAKNALPPGVHIGNNRIAIDFGAMPQATPYRNLFQHIERLEVITRTGVLWFNFELRVTDEQAVAAETDRQRV